MSFTAFNLWRRNCNISYFFIFLFFTFLTASVSPFITLSATVLLTAIFILIFFLKRPLPRLIRVLYKAGLLLSILLIFFIKKFSVTTRSKRNTIKIIIFIDFTAFESIILSNLRPTLYKRLNK